MAALYAGEGVSGWPFAVDGWRWIVSWSGLQATNGTYATDETYGGSRCQPPTANRQPPTANHFAQIGIVPEPVRRDRRGRRDH